MNFEHWPEASDTLELELLAAVSHLKWALRILAQVFQVQYVLLTISLAPRHLFASSC